MKSDGSEFDSPTPEPEAGEIAQIESRSSWNLFLATAEFLTNDGPHEIDSSLIRRFHQIVVADILPDAGEYRRRPVTIANSTHVPPKPRDIPRLIDEMCDHLTTLSAPFEAAAFSLWRLNWIHPFSDGNGRVARAIAFICLNTRLDELVSGAFMSELQTRSTEYYDALEAADIKWAESVQDFTDPFVFSAMSDLLFDIYGNVVGVGGR